MNLLTRLSTAVIFLTPFFANAASPLTATELALHRIEKLVQLKRIDETYITNFQHVSAKALTQSQPTDPAFQTVVSQTTPDSEEAPPKIELVHKADGKVLSHKVATGTAGAPLTWSNKDPVTIASAALHYIEEHSQHQPPLLLFDVGFKDLTVGQDVRDGVLVAIVNVTSNNINQYAEFIIGMDGVVQSWTLK